MKSITRMLAVGAAAALALLGGAGAASADADRPFHGRASGQLTFPIVDTDICPGGMQTQTRADGRFQHLGRTVVYSEHCTPPGPEVTGGVMRLTAANGDELHLTYDAVQLDGPDIFGGSVRVGESFPVVGTFTIDGGTGRFAEASGAGSLTARIVYEGLDDPSWAGSWAFTGTVDY